MNLEAGKCYRTRDGRRVGPIYAVGNGFTSHEFPAAGFHWYGSGKTSYSGEYPDDLIAEWTDIDLSNPLGIVFGKMPKETQKAMMAHGGPWEVFSYGGWGFWGGAQYEWSSDRAYRVKPAPKMETVTYWWSKDWGFSMGNQSSRDTNRITFNLIDGRPDCASIKMEELE